MRFGDHYIDKSPYMDQSLKDLDIQEYLKERQDFLKNYLEKIEKDEEGKEFIKESENEHFIRLEFIEFVKNHSFNISLYSAIRNFLDHLLPTQSSCAEKTCRRFVAQEIKLLFRHQEEKNKSSFAQTNQSFSSRLIFL